MRYTREPEREDRMPGKDLGNKHSCWKCGTKFYDLRKPAPICPKCGADARQSPATKQPAAERKSRAAPREPVAEVVDLEADVEKDLEEGGEDEAEELDDE
jgi:uncharacterized protein (TIGR02300 family)